MGQRIEHGQDKNRFIFQKLGQLLDIGLVFATADGRPLGDGWPAHHPAGSSRELLELLVTGASGQKVPFVYKDSFGVYFGCIRCGNVYALVGPMSQEPLVGVRMHQYYRHYGIRQEDERALRQVPLLHMLSVVELVAMQLLGEAYQDEEIIYANCLVAPEPGHEAPRGMGEDEEHYHHTYNQERRLLDSVREGDAAAAVTYSMQLDQELGRLSGKELNHWKNAAVTAITLCTRAAIEGGLPPSGAYRLSDHYIRKCDGCSDIAQILACRNQAVEEMTGRVKERRQGRSSSSYVERCKDYVANHFREKIYQEELAKLLGISSSYLSRLFHKETGMRLQEYIVQVRAEHAANLLQYSNESIASISEYVNFPSQSYMGKVFQKQFHMSPKQYRESRKPTGF